MTPYYISFFSGNILMLLLISLVLIYGVNGSERNLARAANKFGDDLYRQLAKEKGNIVFSPFSVHSVLALLTLGTRGHTEKELLSKLYLKNLNNLKNMYSAELQERHESIDKNIRIANTLFYDKTLTLFNAFKTAARNIFDVYPEKVNFKETVQAAGSINEWVSNKTNEGITSMVDQESLDYDTVLMLLNAVYFKAKWNVTFNHSDTISDYVFHSPEGDMKCNMMVMKQHRHNYFGSEDFHVLDVSFYETDIKIAFVLPDYKSTSSEAIVSGLHKLEQILNDKTFFKTVKNLRLRMMDIYIPKFKLTGELSLRKHLTSIGMSKIFSNPNLSNMFSRSRLAFVDGVDQKTIVDINEDGVMAAAATKARFVTRSGYRPKFILNAPFLFVLYDSKNEVVLIKGRVVTPDV